MVLVMALWPAHPGQQTHSTRLTPVAALPLPAHLSVCHSACMAPAVASLLPVHLSVHAQCQ